MLHPNPEIGINHESEPRQQIFEIKDAHGDLICKVQAEFRLETGEDGLVRERLMSLFLDGGDGKLVDFLALSFVPGIVIYCQNSDENNYYYDVRKREVMAPFPSNARDLSFLMHELGHADQAREEIWKNLFHFSRLSQTSLSELEPDNYQKVFAVLELMKRYQATGVLAAEDLDRAIELFHQGTKTEQHIKFLTGANQDKVEAARAVEMNFAASHFRFSAADLRRWRQEFLLTDDLEAQERTLSEMSAAGLLIDDANFSEPSRESAPPATQAQKRLACVKALGLIAEALDDLSAGQAVQEELDLFVDFSEDGERTGLAQIIVSVQDGNFEMTIPVLLSARADEVEDYEEQLNSSRAQNVEFLEEIDSLKGQSAEIEKMVEQWFREHGRKLIDELKRPRRLEERDATRRALSWIRQLKQEHQIDLTRDIVVENEFDDCHGVTNVVAELRQALKTYGADSSQMKRGKLKPHRPASQDRAAA